MWSGERGERQGARGNIGKHDGSMIAGIRMIL